MKTKVEFRSRRDSVICTKMMASIPDFEQEIEIVTKNGVVDRLRVVAIQWKVVTDAEDDPVVQIFLG